MTLSPLTLVCTAAGVLVDGPVCVVPSFLGWYLQDTRAGSALCWGVGLLLVCYFGQSVMRLSAG